MLNELFLLSKIKEGNINAFERIFRLYYSPLCLYSASITGQTDIAEEIVQDLFYTLWKKRENIQLFHSIKSYLYGAVKNRSLQFLEHMEVRNRYHDTIQSGGEEDAYSTPQEQLEYKELENLINEVLYHLPERRMLIFKMHRFEGMKYTEIASSLSISVKTVEAEMTKALQTLRKKIELYTA